MREGGPFHSESSLTCFRTSVPAPTMNSPQHPYRIADRRDETVGLYTRASHSTLHSRRPGIRLGGLGLCYKGGSVCRGGEVREGGRRRCGLDSRLSSGLCSGLAHGLKRGWERLARRLRHRLSWLHGSGERLSRSRKRLSRSRKRLIHGLSRMGKRVRLSRMGKRVRLSRMGRNVLGDPSRHRGVRRTCYHARTLRSQAEGTRWRRLRCGLACRLGHRLRCRLSHLLRHRLRHRLSHRLNSRRRHRRRRHWLSVMRVATQGRVAKHWHGGWARTRSRGRNGWRGNWRRSGDWGWSRCIRSCFHHVGEELLADRKICTHIIWSHATAILLKNVAAEICPL